MIQPILFSLITFCCYHTVAAFALGSTNVKEINEAISEKLIVPVSMEAYRKDIKSTNIPLVRIKRQDGENKFAQASNMDQLKIFRVFLQNFKNLWSSTYIGGKHPLHSSVPKPVVTMWHAYIMEFLFPSVGDDAKPK